MKTKFSNSIQNHIACGYLYLDFQFPDLPFDNSSFNNSTLFDFWVPLIYSTPHELVPSEPSELELWNLWFSVTGRTIRDVALEANINWDGRDTLSSDQLIIMKYFDAGLALRYSEVMLIHSAKSSQLPTQRAKELSQPPPQMITSVPETAATTIENKAGSVNIFIFAAIGLGLLIWLCSGIGSRNTNYNPYEDDPLSDPDLYQEGPWPR